MGKGGAQLGKAVKGKSKERKKDKKSRIKDGLSDVSLSSDIRLLEEYEKSSQLADAARLRLKRLMQQEQRHTSINKKIIENIYRQFMRNEKVVSLRTEIEILAQNHSRDVERKDELINSLLKDMEHAEIQIQNTQRQHMQRMNELIEIHNSKISFIENEFNKSLKSLKNEFLTERKEIIQRHELEVKEMNNIINAIETHERDKLNESKQVHETEREEIRNKNLESINELRINLENKIEDLERQFDDAHRQYVESTESANEHFKKLKSEDATLSLHIFEKKKKIQRLLSQKAAMNKKIEFNEKECSQRNNELKQSKESMAQHCSELKNRMDSSHQQQQKKLAQLLKMSHQTENNIKNKIEQAKRILLLAELSRKYETEREKVLPFYQDLNLQNSDNNNNNQQINADQQLLSTSEETASFHALRNFYKKYNKVLLDKHAIEEEKRRLIKENQELKDIMQQYLHSIAITSNALDTANPLLIVNGRSNIIPNTSNQRGRPHVTQDAVQIVNTQIVQTGQRAR